MGATDRNGAKTLRVYSPHSGVDIRGPTNRRPALGIRRDIYESNRWLAASLYKAFLKAKRLADAEFAETTALKISLPWVTAEYEATVALMGADFWSYGVDANYKALATMARYSYEQGLAVRQVAVEEMFAEGNLTEARV